ncbi:hypothetical protein LINPERPRIM_LOCUS1870 [Linum perenne]
MATDSYCTSDLDLLGRPSPIGKLGDDLLVEILIRSFPNPKSSSRCKAVCKQWSSLISSPCFNRRFVSHHQTMNPVPYNPNELQSIILSFLPPLPGNRSVKVLDCFKDLVLCGFWDLNSCEYLEPSRSFLICNPFTEHWIALPLAPNKSGLCSEQVTRLTCFVPSLENGKQMLLFLIDTTELEPDVQLLATMSCFGCIRTCLQATISGWLCLILSASIYLPLTLILVNSLQNMCGELGVHKVLCT